jgi:hypothetical protein
MDDVKLIEVTKGLSRAVAVAGWSLDLTDDRASCRRRADPTF